MKDWTQRRARAVADVTQGAIVATVEIAAPPERVFRALTTVEVTKWWGAPALYQTTGFTADLRPGGAWRSTGVGADGSAFSVGGEYVEVDPPRTLVHTWKPDWDGADLAPTRVSYRLDAIAGGTRVTLRHDGFAGRTASCEDHMQGWERVFGWLSAFCEERPALRYFFLRLVPPRPSFAADMTTVEREAMMAHVAYWRGLLERGRVVVFGPVADPAGAWGAGVLRAVDEAEVEAMRAADPAITAAIGMRYEVLPMLQAFS